MSRKHRIAEEPPRGNPTPGGGVASERRRARLLDAAEDAFGRLGYHGASIVEITRGAGVGLGTFYVHFPSKIEIFRHLLRARLEEFAALARDAAAGAAGREDLVRRTFEAFFAWAGDHPAVPPLLRQAEFVDPALHASLYRTHAERYRAALERAMRAGSIPPCDAEVLAWCVMGMTELSVTRWLVWPGQRRIDPRRFDAFVEIVSRTLGVADPPPEAGAASPG